MNKMAAVLTEVSKAMSIMSSHGYLSVKELIASPMWKYAHDCPEQKHLMAPPTVTMRGADNYQEHFNISGTINYSSVACSVNDLRKLESTILLARHTDCLHALKPL